MIHIIWVVKCLENIQNNLKLIELGYKFRGIITINLLTWIKLIFLKIYKK